MLFQLLIINLLIFSAFATYPDNYYNIQYLNKKNQLHLLFIDADQTTNQPLSEVLRKENKESLTAPVIYTAGIDEINYTPWESHYRINSGQWGHVGPIVYYDHPADSRLDLAKQAILRGLKNIDLYYTDEEAQNKSFLIPPLPSTELKYIQPAALMIPTFFRNIVGPYYEQRKENGVLDTSPRTPIINLNGILRELFNDMPYADFFSLLAYGQQSLSGVTHCTDEAIQARFKSVMDQLTIQYSTEITNHIKRQFHYLTPQSPLHWLIVNNKFRVPFIQKLQDEGFILHPHMFHI